METVKKLKVNVWDRGLRHFRLTVRAQGYETLTLIVPAQSLSDARKFTRQALREWEELNNVDKGTSQLAFVSVTRE